jgi:hypothetical protein
MSTKFKIAQIQIPVLGSRPERGSEATDLAPRSSSPARIAAQRGTAGKRENIRPGALVDALGEFTNPEQKAIFRLSMSPRAGRRAAHPE